MKQIAHYHLVQEIQVGGQLFKEYLQVTYNNIVVIIGVRTPTYDRTQKESIIRSIQRAPYATHLIRYPLVCLGALQNMGINAHNKYHNMQRARQYSVWFKWEAIRSYERITILC